MRWLIGGLFIFFCLSAMVVVQALWILEGFYQKERKGLGALFLNRQSFYFKGYSQVGLRFFLLKKFLIFNLISIMNNLWWVRGLF